MQNEFIPYEQALALKELGFDKPCFKLIETNGIQRIAVNNDYSNKLIDDVGDEQIYFTNQPDSMYYATIPLYSQAFRWFREKYELESWVYKKRDDGYFYYILREDRYLITNLFPIQYENIFCLPIYEEAELECLKQLIEIAKNGK